MSLSIVPFVADTNGINKNIVYSNELSKLYDEYIKYLDFKKQEKFHF